MQSDELVVDDDDDDDDGRNFVYKIYLFYVGVLSFCTFIFVFFFWRKLRCTKLEDFKVPDKILSFRSEKVPEKSRGTILQLTRVRYTRQ